MKKKFAFIVAVFAAVALKGMAQEPFTVKPAPFKKYVQVEKGVQLHQKPSAQSARLAWDDSEESSLLTWRKGKLRPGEMSVDAQVLPVWQEQGEWYKAQYYEKTVFVMKKSCTDVQLRPLKDLGDYQVVRVIPSGKYKDYCLSLTYISGGCQLLLGKYVDGMFIFEYTAECNASHQGSNYMDAEGVVYFNKELADEDGDPSADKIINDAKTIAFLMSNVDNMSHHPLYVFGIEGDDHVYSSYGEEE